MFDIDTVGLPPRTLGQRIVTATGNGRIRSVQQQPVPGCVRRRQQMVRPFSDQSPQGTLDLIGCRQADGFVKASAAGDDAAQDLLVYLGVETGA